MWLWAIRIPLEKTSGTMSSGSQNMFEGNQQEHLRPNGKYGVGGVMIWDLHTNAAWVKLGHVTAAGTSY